MKGFLKKKGVRLTDNAPEDSILVEENEKLWNDFEVNHVIDIFEDILDKKTCLDLEKRLRGIKTTATWGITCGHSCCESDVNVNQSFIRTHHFKKSNEDEIGAHIEKICSRDGLRGILGAVMEKCASVLEGLQSRVQKERVKFSENDAVHIQNEIIKEALVRQIHIAVGNCMIENAKQDVKEGGLLATPAGYNGPRSLNELDASTVSGLMQKGWAFQKNFLGSKDVSRRIFEEVEGLERDGILSEVYDQALKAERKEFICFVNMSDLDRNRHRGLVTLFEALIALPFELNSKTPLALQGSAAFCLGCFPSSGGFYQKHMDGGYGDRDTGRKISVIYFPDAPEMEENAEGVRKQESYGGEFIIGPRRVNPFEIQAETAGHSTVKYVKEVDKLCATRDSILIYRSRDCPIEVLPCSKKRMVTISFFLYGVAGPGDVPPGFTVKQGL